MVDGLNIREVLAVLHGVELLRAELEGFGLFAVGAGEDDDLAAHLGCKLDGQVAQAADADDAHAVGALRVVELQRVEDRRASAHQGRGVLVLDAVGDLEQEVGLPDCGCGEGALVQVGVSVHGALGAEGLNATEALLAVAAAIVLVAPADSVTLFHCLHERTGLFDDAGALMAEGHVGALVVDVGAAETGVGDFDEDFIWADGPAALALDDLAVFGAFPDGEVDIALRHDDICTCR